MDFYHVRPLETIVFTLHACSWFSLFVMRKRFKMSETKKILHQPEDTNGLGRAATILTNVLRFKFRISVLMQYSLKFNVLGKMTVNNFYV